MAETLYDIFDIQTVDRYSGSLITTSGGKAVVTLGSAPYEPATLYNPDNNMASLSQPVAISNGKLRFAVARASTAGSPRTANVFGVTGSGHGFRFFAATPGQMNTVRIDKNDGYSRIVVPFSYVTAVATETDSGLDFPTGALVGPSCWADVRAADSGITLDVGILSSESGGDADGLLKAVSMTSALVVQPKWAATATAGALVLESQDSAATNTPREHLVVAAAPSLSWTLSSGSDTAKGYIVCPYKIGVQA